MNSTFLKNEEFNPKYTKIHFGVLENMLELLTKNRVMVIIFTILRIFIKIETIHMPCCWLSLNPKITEIIYKQDCNKKNSFLFVFNIYDNSSMKYKVQCIL